MRTESIKLRATVARHHPRMPRYVVVPSSALESWRLVNTTVVELSIDNQPVGRRTLKRWDNDRWFLDLPERLCREAGLNTEDRVDLELRIASQDLPGELATLLAKSPEARERWAALSASRKRIIREHVIAAKRPETRRRRARVALGIDH